MGHCIQENFEVFDFELSGDELAFVVDDCRPRVVIWQDAEIGDRVRAARARQAMPGRALRGA